MFVALIHRSAKFVGVNIDVGKQAFQVALAFGAYSRSLNGLEHIVERYIEVGIIFCAFAHIAEKLRRKNEETFLVYELFSSRFGFIVGEVGIVEAFDACFSLKAIDVVSDIFRYKAIEKYAENITLEIPAVNRVA